MSYVGRRLLIVEDNPVNLKLIAQVLSADGFQIHCATTAEAAEAHLQSSLPDLILMDIALPQMDGLTLTRMLKADPRYRNIPIVALTASAMVGDDRKALDAGCIGYITKPVNTRTVAAEIMAFMKG
jgi:CheY-like chemotaxis protein